MYGWGAATNPACSNWFYAVTNPSGCLAASAIDAAATVMPNDAAGKNALNCGSFWSKWQDLSSLSACWCLENPMLCPNDTHAAARLLNEPAMLPTLPAPPVISSTLPDGSDIPPVPESGAAAEATIDALIAKQWREWQPANAAAMSTYTPPPDPEPFSIPWWVWAVGGVGVFGLVALSAGGPRRYGR
jgi:hypothetical protein